MKVTLAQALPLRKQMERELQLLRNERNDAAFEEAEKSTEKPMAQGRTLDEITKEIEQVHDDLLTLQDAMDKANFAATITWDENEISLLQAIEHAKFLRQEASFYISNGSKKPVDRSKRNFMDKNDLIRVAMYEPKVYLEKGKKMERQANLLSGIIESANHQVSIDFNAEKYIGE
jgi:hypothetical protein